ncbi:MAG: hypothetical protein HOV68_04990, partial [Streptomycetaceae bacterium]|nr:hypothetical protein [Streptomycetaceae bacterium]
MRDRARPAVSNRRRIRVAAAAGVAALMAVLGACADDADRRPAASGSASPDTASPQQPASPPTETSAIVPTAPPTPTTSPADAEILNLLATLDVAPQTAKGGLDEAAAAKRLAEPMLSLVKASWRVVRPEWRLDGNLGTLADPRIWRPATSPGADTWVGVSGFLGTGGHDALFLFRSTPADPTWKLAFVSFLQ